MFLYTMVIRVGEFSSVLYKIRFCLKINIAKGKHWILRISVVGRCQKGPKFDFQSQFSMSWVIGIFLNYFFIKDYQFRNTFFVFDTFWYHQFLNHFITKMMTNFWQLATTPILKIQEFPCGMLIFRQKYF